MTTVIRRSSAKDIMAHGLALKAKKGANYDPSTCPAFSEFLRRYRNNVALIGTDDRRAQFAEANAEANMKRMVSLAGTDAIEVSPDSITIGGEVVTPPEKTEVIRTSLVNDGVLDVLREAVEHVKSKGLTQALAILTIYEGGIDGSDLARSLGVKAVTQSLIARSLDVTPGYVSNVIRDERTKRDNPAPAVDTDAVFSAVDALV